MGTRLQGRHISQWWDEQSKAISLKIYPDEIIAMTFSAHFDDLWNMPTYP